eukprot:scpid60061/ scgid16764/ 
MLVVARVVRRASSHYLASVARAVSAKPDFRLPCCQGRRGFHANLCFRSENEPLVVNVESEQMISGVGDSTSTTPQEAATYEVVPEERNRNINKDVRAFIATYHLVDFDQVIRQTSSLCNRPALRDVDRIALTTHVLQFFAEKEDAVFAHFKELAHVHQILASGQADAPRELQRFTASMLRAMTAEDQCTLNIHDVTFMLRVLTYNDDVTPEIVKSFGGVHDLVLRYIGTVKTVPMLLRMLTTVGYRKDDDSDVAYPELCKAVLRRLGDYLPERLPGKSIHGVQVTLEGANIVSRVAMRHEEFLAGYCRRLHSILRCEGMRHVTEASGCAYLLSYFGHQDKEVLRHIRKAVDNRRRTELQTNSLRVYVRLNWAMQAQDLDPPTSSLRTMTSFLERHDYRYDARVARELQLLMPYLEKSKTPLRDVMLREARRDQRLSGVVDALQAFQPNVLSYRWLECGVVPVMALVCKDTQSIVPWPQNITPEQVTKENVDRLPAMPVALFLVEGQHMLVQPKGYWSGVVEKQRRILDDKGWRVGILPLADVSQSQEPAEDCLKALLDMTKPKHLR